MNSPSPGLNPQVFRDFPPEALQMGILACGSVENYYNACIEAERAERMRLMASASHLGFQVSSPYPDNIFEVVENTVTEVGRTPLNFINDLMEAGLETPLPNWWGIPSLRRRNRGTAGRAHRTMIPDSRGERFVLQEGAQTWPVFCTWANFSFNARELAIAQRLQAPLDTDHIAQATYLVQEACEDQAINGLTDEQGSTMTIDGMSAPGLLGSNITFGYSTWTGLTGAQIVAEVQGAIELIRIKRPGPYRLYIPSNYSEKVTSDYSSTYPGTILTRLQQLGPWGGRNLEVRISDTLPDNRVVIVPMNRQSVDVVVGQQTIPISWKDGPGWNTYWVVLSCVIFRMFQDDNGDYGVVVGDLE